MGNGENPAVPAQTPVFVDDALCDVEQADIGQFKEFNRRGNVDKYIQYIKDSNELFNVAKEELLEA